MLLAMDSIRPVVMRLSWILPYSWLLTASVALLGTASVARAQRSGELAPNAPRDRPVPSSALCQRNALYRTIAPLVAAARASYPVAKQRFAAGLPRGETFFVTAQLRDAFDRHEQVFVAVNSIVGDTIRGRIASPIQVLQGYRYGQPFAVLEAELLDWTIAKPDGSEEGNVVGKFLDTYQPVVCTDSTRAG